MTDDYTLVQMKKLNSSLAEKANKTIESTITPTMLNGWITGATPTGYFKDNFGIVHITGTVKSGTVNSPIFILPIGYRPITACSFAIISNSAFGRIVIATTGEVTLSTGSNVFADLYGINFIPA